MSWIGRSIRRFEDPALLLGRGRYTSDLARGAAAVRFVRSAVARGRIVAIKAPEGALVFTAAHLAGVKAIRPILHRPDYVPVAQPALASGRVNFLGEAVAVVVADDAAAAEDLADQVEIEIDAETPVVDVDTALEADAPIVHAPSVHAEGSGNVILEGAMKTVGLDAAFARAAKVVEIDVRSRRSSAASRAPIR